MMMLCCQGLLRERDIQTLVANVSSTQRMNPSLFEDLKEGALDVLILDYYADYRESSFFTEYQKTLSQKEARRSSATIITLPADLEGNRKELQEMFSTNRTARFKQFLSEGGEVSKFLFYFEVEDFKAIPTSQIVYVQGRAQKVGMHMQPLGAAGGLRFALACWGVIRADL
jgi:hypothetical protein